jgi:hypothetical protein
MGRKFSSGGHKEPLIGSFVDIERLSDFAAQQAANGESREARILNAERRISVRRQIQRGKAKTGNVVTVVIKQAEHDQVSTGREPLKLSSSGIDIRR